MNNSILTISVTQANTQPWLKIWKEGQTKTWMSTYDNLVNIINIQSKKTPELIMMFDRVIEKHRYSLKYGTFVSHFNSLWTKFLSSNIPKARLIASENLLIIDCWSTYMLTNQRNLGFYKYFLENINSDFLFQTNSSSYVDCFKLIKLLEVHDARKDLYAGFIVNPKDKIKFVSGAGRLLSRKTIERIVANYKKYPKNNLEDISLGYFLHGLGVSPINLPRVELPDIKSVLDLTDSTLQKNFLYRCKSKEKPRNDIDIMNILHKRLTDVS